ncbi:MAG: metalloprotease [Sphingobacteriales bacterium]|nr:MAG: metalloprotease [Sphingobacteriales bacterium]
MRWRGERESNNVEDRRGMGGGGKVAVGGGLGAIIIVVIGLLTGKDFSSILATDQQTQTTQQTDGPRAPRADDSTAQFIKVVLGSTEDVWNKIYAANGEQYQQPRLVMFDNSVESACGSASSAMGPFYCPGDNKVYIDLSFCSELRDRFQAPGNFAVAYVVAHEVGHHIQNLMGLSEQMQRQRGRLSEAEYNKLSVKLELQADFLAGVWAYHANKMRNILEPGDLESALNAANAIGDDKLQKEAQGYIVPDAFTHGSSQQRMYWFKKGFQTGDLNQGKYEDIR